MRRVQVHMQYLTEEARPEDADLWTAKLARMEAWDLVRAVAADNAGRVMWNDVTAITAAVAQARVRRCAPSPRRTWPAPAPAPLRAWPAACHAAAWLPRAPDTAPAASKGRAVPGLVVDGCQPPWPAVTI